LTTVTTFVGLIPIMAEQSTSAQFLKPAVLSLAFGVFFALFVSLLWCPRCIWLATTGSSASCQKATKNRQPARTASGRIGIRLIISRRASCV